MRRPLMFLSLLVLGAVAGCQSSTDPSASALAATLTAQSTVLRVGDSTVMTMEVRNPTPVPVSRDVLGGSLPFDVVIERLTGEEVWRRSSQVTSSPARQLTVPAGGAVSFQFTLRVGGPGGVNLAAGEYRVRAFYVTSGREIIATANPALRFIIQAAP